MALAWMIGIVATVVAVFLLGVVFGQSAWLSLLIGLGVAGAAAI